MPTYVMFGKYSPESLRAVTAGRTDEAVDLIKQYDGVLKASYALLGDVDLVVVVELPDTDQAMKLSAALTMRLGISFTTAPAVTIEEFDRLMAHTESH